VQVRDHLRAVGFGCRWIRLIGAHRDILC
jgi:hypothetical protein